MGSYTFFLTLHTFILQDCMFFSYKHKQVFWQHFLGSWNDDYIDTARVQQDCWTCKYSVFLHNILLYS